MLVAVVMQLVLFERMFSPRSRIAVRAIERLLVTAGVAFLISQPQEECEGPLTKDHSESILYHLLPASHSSTLYTSSSAASDLGLETAAYDGGGYVL